MTTRPQKPAKPTHPWRAFNPGWLSEKPRQVPHNEVKKP